MHALLWANRHLFHTLCKHYHATSNASLGKRVAARYGGNKRAQPKASIAPIERCDFELNGVSGPRLVRWVRCAETEEHVTPRDEVRELGAKGAWIETAVCANGRRVWPIRPDRSTVLRSPEHPDTGRVIAVDALREGNGDRGH